MNIICLIEVDFIIYCVWYKYIIDVFVIVIILSVYYMYVPWNTTHINVWIGAMLRGAQGLFLALHLGSFLEVLMELYTVPVK